MIPLWIDELRVEPGVHGPRASGGFTVPPEYADELMRALSDGSSFDFCLLPHTPARPSRYRRIRLRLTGWRIALGLRIAGLTEEELA